MKRSYKQNCALANALDRVGDRWTLLIVRELLCGNRRYGELVNNLQGIGTNLLATRLKEMETSGLISKDKEGYGLTASGLNIEPMVLEMVRFGLGLKLENNEEYLTRPEWDSVALKAMYKPEFGAPLEGRFVLQLDEQPFLIDRQGETIKITAEDFSSPKTRVKLKISTARKLSAGKLSLAQGLSRGLVKVKGAEQYVSSLLRSFGLVS